MQRDAGLLSKFSFFSATFLNFIDQTFSFKNIKLVCIPLQKSEISQMPIIKIDKCLKMPFSDGIYENCFYNFSQLIMRFNSWNAKGSGLSRQFLI